MPVREKGRRRLGSQPAVPSHVPSHPHNAAKVRGFSLTAPGLTAETDCLLEESRFRTAGSTYDGDGSQNTDPTPGLSSASLT